MDHFFSAVDGPVLEPHQQRTYACRGSALHLLWTRTMEAGSGAPTVGALRRLKSDGSTFEQDSEQLQTAHRRGVDAILTVDGATGQRVALHHPSQSGSVLHAYSPQVPSGRAIASMLWCPGVPAPHATMSEWIQASAVDGDPATVVVSDDVGNLSRLSMAATPSEAGVPAKRVRVEGDSLDVAPPILSFAWHSLTPAASAMPSLALPEPSSDQSGWDLFDAAMGSPGWVGLCRTGDSSTAPLVCAREGYYDVRVMDMDERAGSVLRSYGTTHGPTGMASTDMPSVVAVAEGCLATLFDVRCPSAVLTLAQSVASDAETAAAATAAAASGGGCLIPGRLTSVSGNISDVCCTARPFELVCSIDRAVTVYDIRKFTRHATHSNVLKYRIASIAPTAGGSAIVCAGIDAEVRIVPLTHHAGNPTEAKSSVASSATKEEEAAPGGTFRTRLNTSVSCSTTWQGGLGKLHQRGSRGGSRHFTFGRSLSGSVALRGNEGKGCALGHPPHTKHTHTHAQNLCT